MCAIFQHDQSNVLIAFPCALNFNLAKSNVLAAFPLPLYFNMANGNVLIAFSHIHKLNRTIVMFSLGFPRTSSEQYQYSFLSLNEHIFCLVSVPHTFHFKIGQSGKSHKCCMSDKNKNKCELQTNLYVHEAKPNPPKSKICRSMPKHSSSWSVWACVIVTWSV